jgi:hypothetical protein
MTTRFPKEARGDHGFTGMALLAWKRQRQAQMDLIEHDAWRVSKDAKERGWFVLLKVARNACPCPQTFDRHHGTPEGLVWVGKFVGWPEKPNLSRANLSGANLSGAKLSGANLSGANLSAAYLSWANLSRADLSGANLSGAYLSGAKLSGADLSRANLSRADLSGANLSRANLSRAYLSRAYLSGATLSGADLSGANLGDYERGPDGFARLKKRPPAEQEAGK